MKTTAEVIHDDGKARIRLYKDPETSEIYLDGFELIEGKDTVEFRNFVMDRLDDFFEQGCYYQGVDEINARQQWEGI